MTFNADTRKLARAHTSQADALILDWEDGTGRNDKDLARRETLTFCTSPNRKPVFVRINPVDSPELRSDREALQEALPDGVVVPKCASADVLRKFASLVESARPGRPCAPMPLIETSPGLLRSDAIAACSPLVVAVGFRAEDFKAATGITPGPDGDGLLYARSRVVISARGGC